MREALATAVYCTCRLLQLQAPAVAGASCTWTPCSSLQGSAACVCACLPQAPPHELVADPVSLISLGPPGLPACLDSMGSRCLPRALQPRLALRAAVCSLRCCQCTSHIMAVPMCRLPAWPKDSWHPKWDPQADTTALHKLLPWGMVLGHSSQDAVPVHMPTCMSLLSLHQRPRSPQHIVAPWCLAHSLTCAQAPLPPRAEGAPRCAAHVHA